MKSFFNNRIKNSKDLNRGLTMVESLIAIGILTMSIIGPMAIIAQALKSSYVTRDQITAYYLAQEVVEYVKNVRDNNGLKTYRDQNSWLDNLLPGGDSLSINPSNADYIGAAKYSLVRSPLGVYRLELCNVECSKLRKSPDTPSLPGYYGSDSSGDSDTPFTREILFYHTETDPTSAREIQIVVNIYWKVGATPQTFILKENITNWITVGSN